MMTKKDIKDAKAATKEALQLARIGGARRRQVIRQLSGIKTESDLNRFCDDNLGGVRPIKVVKKNRFCK